MMEVIVRYNGKRLLYVTEDGLVASEGYALYRYIFADRMWRKYATVDDRKNAFFSCTGLTRRLTRSEITKYYQLKNGIELCIARKGIFRKEMGSDVFNKTFNVVRGSRPINICEDVDGKLYFGEYFANMEKAAVNIYCSEDSGQTWNVCYTFPDGNINHIHGIYMDPFTKKMWVATGDRENECIIGYTDDGFKTIKEVLRGGQDYRTCTLLFYKDFIVFATDSQYQENEIRKFDRESLEIETLQKVQGPVIRGIQMGNVSVISTDVEPSDVNNDQNAYLWLSKDGMKWEQVYAAKKDCLNPMLFQFGVFDLPEYSETAKEDMLYFTGKAVKGCSGDTIAMSLI